MILNYFIVKLAVIFHHKTRKTYSVFTAMCFMLFYSYDNQVHVQQWLFCSVGIMLF